MFRFGLPQIGRFSALTASARISIVRDSSMAIVLEGQAAGLLRAGDPMEIALVLWASMHGLAVLLTEGQLGRHDRPVQAVGVAKLVSGLLLDGLLRRPASGAVKEPRRRRDR